MQEGKFNCILNTHRFDMQMLANNIWFEPSLPEFANVSGTLVASA
jgi:hypothetical protein